MKWAYSRGKIHHILWTVRFQSRISVGRCWYTTPFIQCGHLWYLPIVARCRLTTHFYFMWPLSFLSICIAPFVTFQTIWSCRGFLCFNCATVDIFRNGTIEVLCECNEHVWDAHTQSVWYHDYCVWYICSKSIYIYVLVAVIRLLLMTRQFY